VADLVRAARPQERLTVAPDDQLASGDHTIRVPDHVRPQAAFATVKIDASIYAFGVAA